MKTENQKLWELNYAKKKLEGDIPKINFKTSQDLIDAVIDETSDSVDLVWIVSVDEEILISNDSMKIEFLLQVLLSLSQTQEVFVFEFGSYEEAYKVALDMKETNPLCYEQEEEAGGICSDNLN